MVLQRPTLVIRPLLACLTTRRTIRSRHPRQMVGAAGAVGRLPACLMTRRTIRSARRYRGQRCTQTRTCAACTTTGRTTRATHRRSRPGQPRRNLRLMARERRGGKRTKISPPPFTPTAGSSAARCMVPRTPSTSTRARPTPSTSCAVHGVRASRLRSHGWSPGVSANSTRLTPSCARPSLTSRTRCRAYPPSRSSAHWLPRPSRRVSNNSRSTCRASSRPRRSRPSSSRPSSTSSS
mmetsp:Transcript_94133/g.269555  ORF Transcript_94133/g.269555 Transcript_94133/m.269555 type:complete len:237 (+) Transcript_94133:411-1121(+)